jgi:hypothetical protein
VFPDDLNDKAADWVARELFDEDLASAVPWTLKRLDQTTFELVDQRFAGPWPMTHGYLVSLHEVSTRVQARDFAKKNRIKLLDDGGYFYKGTAEVLVRASIPPLEEHRTIDDFYRIVLASGVEATLGYRSLLFSRLVAEPAAEEFPSLPDTTTFTTMVLKDVDRDEVRDVAEQALFHFRRGFQGLTILPGRIPDFVSPPDVSPNTAAASRIAACAETTRPEAIAFYNRGVESEPVLGFLYLYRVLEACFDDVLKAEIAAWRSDALIDEVQLLTNVRGLTQKEDVWSLRRVLGAITDQATLDTAHRDALIQHPTADALASAVYLRRNSIAHGRRGQHARVLVPFCVSGEDGADDVRWLGLMKKLADAALMKWILGH